MYELQGRVEAKQETGALTDEQAAELIAQIVDIKQTLLANTPIEEAKTKMSAFKTTYQTTMRGTA